MIPLLEGQASQIPELEDVPAAAARLSRQFAAGRGAAAHARVPVEMQSRQQPQQQPRQQQQQQHEPDEPAARGWSVLDAVQQHWYAPILATGLWQIARGGSGASAAPVPRSTKALQALALAALLLAAVQLERFLGAGVMRPLLDRLFGSNEELRRRLAKTEAETHATLRLLKEQRERGEAGEVSGAPVRSLLADPRRSL
jgi:hypothetical protein